MTKSELWILSEWWVACDRARHHGESLLAHRLITPFAEIDLLMTTPELLTLVEVKTHNEEIWGPQLISRRQLERLLRAREFLAAKFSPRPVRFLLATLDPRKCHSVPLSSMSSEINQGMIQGWTGKRYPRSPLVRYFDPCDGINGWLDG